VVETENQIKYLVVVNEEEQYSIWPSYKTIPMGWKEEGFQGSKESCLDHIGKVWKDMRPLSLRKRMELRKNELEKHIREIETQPAELPPKSQTVEFLLRGEHPFQVHSSQASVQEFNRAIEMGCIYLVFTNTIGQTCLRIDFSQIHRYEESDLESCTLKGSLELDFVPLSCSLQIDISSMKGIGSFMRKQDGFL